MARLYRYLKFLNAGAELMNQQLLLRHQIGSNKRALKANDHFAIHAALVFTCQGFDVRAHAVGHPQHEFVGGA